MSYKFVETIQHFEAAGKEMNICFVSQVDPEHLDEYKSRHNPIWPEMLKALETAGWREYRIYLSPTGLLVGTANVDSYQDATERMQDFPINALWQKEMSVFFTGDGAAPDTGFQEIDLVFDMEAQLSQLAQSEPAKPLK